MTLYDELVWRGFVKDVSNEEKAKQLLNEDKVKFYCGFDPTGQSLTVGHLVQIVRIMLIAKYGHHPVVLIGGATGLIGDPRQTSERKLLTLEQSLENAEKIKKQIGRFQKEATFVNNNDWISKIDMISFLRDYGKNFNINYMLSKETVQARLETGISYTEFSYMIIQAIDWLHLYQTIDCKIQFGGSDQWGNITTGLELIRKTVGDKHDAVAMSSPLLLKSDGTKFGKSESGALWLDETLTSPYELYQYFLNTADDDVANYLKMLTLLDKEEIELLIQSSIEKPEERLAQKRLASEVTKLVHGEEQLKQAINVSNSLFSGEFGSLTIDEFKMAQKGLDSIEKDEINILDALIELKLAQSKREAREFVKNGAVLINDEKITDFDFVLSKNIGYYNTYAVVRRGKKKFALVVFK
ncbi:Tyrosyl-tRNA synthetase [Paracholeplasma brassicae]|uniref:Tyrosine--tRNA ligase n=1 Tax=Acholeplasma brassicae TaxID=61635 RepID=U4KTB0_9MOLU|nr:tyrosine--tRNA ligase [Paracholeplasma brassicae]CCV66374.1 Tyrosyl-tRNA synthetase [Paracholeplasma brassicae]